MPWAMSRRQEDDKIEFELSPEVKAEIEAGKKAAEELAALKAELATRNASIETMRTEFEELKQSFTAEQAEKERLKPKPVESDEPSDEDYFANPKEAVSKTINKTMLPLATALAEARADKIMDDLRRMYPELNYAAVAEDFEATVSKYGIANRANKEFMVNAFRVTRDRLRENGKLDAPEFQSFMEVSRRNGSSGYSP